MSGVDKGDQFRGYYRVWLKCMKYYKYILFDVSITNAFILSSYVPTTTSKHTLKKFRLMLATQLIGNYNRRRRAGRPSSNATSTLGTCRRWWPTLQQRPRLQLHLPSHGQSRRCVYCGSYRSPQRRRECVAMQRVSRPADAMPNRQSGRYRLLQPLACKLISLLPALILYNLV